MTDARLWFRNGNFNLKNKSNLCDLFTNAILHGNNQSQFTLYVT